MNENLSPNQKAVRRLLKNRPALFGLFLIAFSVFVALFGYLLAPDASPNANEQLATVALKSPRFGIDMLKIKKNRTIEKVGFFEKILRGEANSYELVPITGFEIVQDSIVVQKYSGYDSSEYPSEKAAFHLADVAFAIADIRTLKREGNDYIFRNLDGGEERQNITNTRQIVEKECVTHKTFWLGTDNFGRDILSRLILGVRISLLVGLIAVLISLSIGIFVGAVAGYFGGKIDDFLMLIINTVWSIPTILLVFAIVLAFGRGIGIIFLAVGLTMWVDVARLVRGQVLGLKEMQFVEAAQTMGFGTARILMRHILPNILGPVMVVAASNFATAILIESGLSYLGFGIQPPTPSWGTMLYENYGYAIGGKPFLAMIPAFAIMLMVLAFNLVGNGFRDALDVKSTA